MCGGGFLSDQPRPARDRATTTPAHATNANAPASIPVIDVACARALSPSPQRIAPTYSTWARNDCTVARTSLVVRLLTQIAPTARVTVHAMPATRSTPALPVTVLGATVSRSTPSAPIPHAAV